MALNLSYMQTFINTLVRLDPTTPQPTNAQQLDIINEVYFAYYAAYGQFSSNIAGTFSAGTTTRYSVSLVSAPLIGVDAVEFSAGAGSFVPLDLRPEDYIRYLQDNEGRQGNPTMASIKANVDSGGAWSVSGYLYPIRTSTPFLRIFGRLQPAELVGATDVPNLNPVAFFIVGRLAAAQVAVIARRPAWLVDRILEPVPEKVRLAFDVDRYLNSTLRVASRSVRAALTPSRDALLLPELSQLVDDQ